jgi:RNA polymerase sigma-70 factor, ECF subfamily
VGTLREKQVSTHLDATAEPQRITGQESREISGTGFSRGANVQDFQTFYQENIGPIYRFVYSKVGNREEAEDLTSQVFLKAARWIDCNRDALSAQGWLFQVARRTIADHWRSVYQFRANSLDDLLDAGLDLPAEERAPMDTSVTDRRVERVLARLPARYRDVLSYRFLLNYSIKETATALGISAANVKVIQFRALKKASESDPNDLDADS